MPTTTTTAGDRWQLLASTPTGQAVNHRARRGSCVITVKLPAGQTPTQTDFDQAWNTRLATWKATHRR